MPSSTRHAGSVVSVRPNARYSLAGLPTCHTSDDGRPHTQRVVNVVRHTAFPKPILSKTHVRTCPYLTVFDRI